MLAQVYFISNWGGEVSDKSYTALHGEIACLGLLVVGAGAVPVLCWGWRSMAGLWGFADSHGPIAFPLWCSVHPASEGWTGSL